MRKLMKFVATLLIFLILIAGGVGGYLWYDTKQRVDQFVMLAKPFAEISYGGIEISPTGSLGINRLRITPHTMNDVITIGALQLKAPNILELLKTYWQLRQGEPPQALSLSMRELELSLQGDLLGSSSSSIHQRTPFEDLDALGCGQVAHLASTEWQEMGYDRFVGNAEIGYRFDAAHNILTFQVDNYTRNWATLNMSISLALSGPVSSIIALANQEKPRLASLDLAFQDDGFNQRRNDYCAAKAGKTVDDYLADHVRLLVARLHANGIDLGPGLITAYRQFLNVGGRLSLTATPPAPIDPTDLQHYATEDVIKLLGLKMQVNNETVTDLSVNWDNAKIAHALNTQMIPEKEIEKLAPAAPTEQVVIIQKNYHSIPVGALDQHIGKIAKLETTTGATFRGLLEMVSKEGIKIKINKSGGSVTLSLRSNEIRSAQVLY
ncbi:MAG: hypothetical protein IAF00_05750 [Phycisphaerales bacterium]|nr:hypothetical protein [Phycisphaerales bacterium]